MKINYFRGDLTDSSAKKEAILAGVGRAETAGWGASNTWTPQSIYTASHWAQRQSGVRDSICDRARIARRTNAGSGPFGERASMHSVGGRACRSGATRHGSWQGRQRVTITSYVTHIQHATGARSRPHWPEAGVQQFFFVSQCINSFTPKICYFYYWIQGSKLAMRPFGLLPLGACTFGFSDTGAS